MKKSMYQIQTEYQQIADALTTGELTPELEQALAIAEHELEVKSVNYSFVIKDINDEISIINAEIDRLKDLKKVRENALERLKNNISNAMQLFQVDEIKTPLIKINFRKSESVEIDNMALLDAKFLNEKITITPDKMAIKEAIKNGEDVNGARLVINNNIQIK
jgi:hypothetical protein